MGILQKLAHRSNYGGKRNPSQIKYIVIHYTGNDGDTDQGNGNYFGRNANLKASAHYFVDSDSVTQSVPDNYVAYAVGSRRGYKHPYCRNANSLSIELCDDKRGGGIYPSQQTIDRALELTRQLMSKYHIPAQNVIRHYDVTGKLCPMYWCGNAQKDRLWYTEFHNKLGEHGENLPYKVRVEIPDLKIRKSYTIDTPVVGHIHKGEVYTIVSEHGNWGKLKSGAGWIFLDYVKKV